MAGANFVLRFIAGKYKGGEFPLRPNREVIVGRGSEFDMVLDEDMVSRRHAKIATYHGQIVFQDLNSTNGSFVNGERVTVARLKEGDKVLVGTSIMEMVAADTALSRTPTSAPAQVDVPPPDQSTTEGSPATLGHLGQPSAPPAGAPLGAARPTIDRSQGMSGRFPEDGVDVSDLIELFANNGRSGVLVLADEQSREGRVFFRDGAFYHANIADPHRPGVALPPLKAFGRLCTWESGTFRMDNLSPPPTFDEEVEGDTRQHLTDAVRQFDELKLYKDHVPGPEESVALKSPLVPRLSALSAEALDTLQVVLNHGQVGAILDYSEASDLETVQDLLYLLQNEYIVQV